MAIVKAEMVFILWDERGAMSEAGRIALAVGVPVREIEAIMAELRQAKTLGEVERRAERLKREGVISGYGLHALNPTVSAAGRPERWLGLKLSIRVPGGVSYIDLKVRVGDNQS